jgi:hypothetical protein
VGQPTGGLCGVRVVDFGHYIAGPLAALLLAEAGADVVHVDAPGESAIGPADAYFNRGKRRITLDLKSPAGQATARGLAARGRRRDRELPARCHGPPRAGRERPPRGRRTAGLLIAAGLRAG